MVVVVIIRHVGLHLNAVVFIGRIIQYPGHLLINVIIFRVPRVRVGYMMAIHERSTTVSMVTISVDVGLDVVAIRVDVVMVFVDVAMGLVDVAMGVVDVMRPTFTAGNHGHWTVIFLGLFLVFSSIVIFRRWYIIQIFPQMTPSTTTVACLKSEIIAFFGPQVLQSLLFAPASGSATRF